MTLETADQVSKKVARCIIDNALQIAQGTGKRKPKERKSRFTRELEREIGLIREVRDLLRKLSGNLFSPEEETSLQESLNLYLDILSLMDLPSLPLGNSVESLTKWSEESAEHEIEPYNGTSNSTKLSKKVTKNNGNVTCFSTPKRGVDGLISTLSCIRQDPQILRLTEKRMRKRETRRKSRKFTLKRAQSF
jgi:hypothetical protein